jgi:general stress protein YciG
MADNNSTSNRGFAAMDEDEIREIASKGGKMSPGNFANDRAKASRAGRKGGKASRGGVRTSSTQSISI